MEGVNFSRHLHLCPSCSSLLDGMETAPEDEYADGISGDRVVPAFETAPPGVEGFDTNPVDLAPVPSEPDAMSASQTPTLPQWVRQRLLSQRANQQPRRPGCGSAPPKALPERERCSGHQ